MENTCNKTRTPIYRPFYENLRRSITEGKIAAGNWIGSECEFAREHNLSRVSVRKAIDELIEEGLVERRAGVGLFVRQLHMTTKTVQIIVPNLEIHQHVLISRGAKTCGMELGVGTQIIDAHGQTEHDLEKLSHLPESKIDGAIIISLPSSRFNEVIYGLKSVGFPFILVDGALPGSEVPFVMADNYAGGYTVGKELIKLGHHRIAFIGNLEAQTTHKRMEGLRDAICDSGLQFDRKLIFDLCVSDPLVDWSELVHNMTVCALESANRPTAIFYSCDVVASQGYRTLRSLGVRVPEDISVIGFDGDAICQILDPELATVRQPSEAIGRAAMELLVSRMADPKGVAESRVLPVEWCKGGSVCRLATAKVITPIRITELHRSARRSDMAMKKS